MAKELKGLALGLTAGLGVVGLAYISSAVVTHAAPTPTQAAGEKTGDKAPAPPAATDTTQMVATGRKLYVANCAGCHGQDAEGKIGPNLHALGDPDARVYRHIANGFGRKMPAYKDILSKDQIDTLVAYIQTLK